MNKRDDSADETGVLMRRMSGRNGLAAAVFLVETIFWCLGAEAQAVVHFDLPAQPLARSLNAIGTATNTDVGFNAAQVAGFLAPALRDNLTVDGALTRVLVGTGLRPQHLDDRTIVIAAFAATGSDAAERNRLVLAKAAADNQATPPGAGVGDTPDDSSSLNSRKGALDEIVVTGTLIPGAEPASRVSTYTRAEIANQGFASVEDFIQSLPQNFNGGASENTAFSGSGNSSNIVNATGINLRGLGNDATLVLINGHRIAPANWQGNFVDISMIPLSAIERVDVMADGASAIYGSDAVGGVVNFILRQDLDGTETRLRYGSVTQGDRNDIQASQVIGQSWGSGSALLVYDFDRATALSASERSYTAQTTTEPFTLLPQQERNSVLLTARQSMGQSLELFGDGLYSHRTVDSDVTGDFTFPTSQNQRSKVDSYYVNAGGRASLSDAIKFELTANYSATRTRYDIYDLTSENALFTDDRVDANLFAIDAKLDGTLATLSTGPVLFAIGGEYRRDAFSIFDTVDPTSQFSDSRDVAAAFAELHIPLIGSLNSRNQNQPNVLELELADRYERYSDFGRTNNPKGGFIWRVLPELKLHGSYGTSFVAPVLSALNPVYGNDAAFPGTRAGPDIPNFIYIFGGNPNLQPQKSKEWEFGADFTPQDDPRVRAYANYFHISYTNRITNALSIVNSLGAAFQLGPPLVQLNPSASTLQALESVSTFVNHGVANLATIGAILDDRQQNLSSVETSGFDFGASYKFGTGRWRSEVGIDGTYIFQFDNRVIATSPVLSLLNQAGNPIDLKFRAHGSLQRGPLSAALFINFVNSYENLINDQSVPVASWTTVDLMTSYEFGRAFGYLVGTTVQVGVTNLLDRAPPYVANPDSNGINYDGANANALGRFVYLQLVKRW
jgi:iron complex outermembrane receptor protein